MDPITRFTESLRELVRQMPRSQRIATAMVLLALVGGLTAIVLNNSAGRYVPLALGSEFGADRLPEVEQLLRDHKLHDFQRDGAQILIPADRVADYNSAIRTSAAGPQNWAADWEEKFRETNPFTSSHELKTLKEISLAKELRRVILGLEGIEEASVVWADSDARRGWGVSRRRVTATVNVRPQPNTALPLQTVRAIQFSVANMVPDLQPEDVVVFDLVAGRHYQLDADQARFEAEFDLWREAELAAWSRRLTSLIQRDWPTATVTVEADAAMLRNLAWSLMWDETHAPRFEQEPETHSSTASQTERAPQFAAVKSQLVEQLPQYLTLLVSFPESALSNLFVERELPTDWNTNEGQFFLQELHGAILQQLPTSIAESSLRVTVSAPAVRRAGEQQAAIVPIVNLSPGLLLSAVACCLMGFAFAWRSITKQPSSAAAVGSPVRVSAIEPADKQVSLSEAIPPASATTPLGDPEMVAIVLQNWLSRSTPPRDSSSEH